MIDGSAVDVIVASSAVSRPAKPMATMIAQNLKPGLKGTTVADGGLTADASCMAGSLAGSKTTVRARNVVWIFFLLVMVTEICPGV